MTTNDPIELHRQYQGKIHIQPNAELNEDNFKLFYTPGIGKVSDAVSKGALSINEVSWRKNLVAVISDGSAVLGLGDIGPDGAMPVMEGKAFLFKSLAGIDAIPIVLNVHTPDEIVATIAAIAPSFSGINLEDIASPKCFAIEKQLNEILDIPVMHDDQHGTAIVVLAGLINAAKVVGKKIQDMRIVILGAGAAGNAIARLLDIYASPDIICIDSKGIISSHRQDLNDEKKLLLKFNKRNLSGTLQDGLRGSDVIIGVSKANTLDVTDIGLMAKDAIVFALANPVPEIMPDLAIQAGAKVVATGRSDFANQINNVLVFPGMFKGALKSGIVKFTEGHKIHAAEALANLVEHPTPDNIVPSVFDKNVVSAVSEAIN